MPSTSGGSGLPSCHCAAFVSANSTLGQRTPAPWLACTTNARERRYKVTSSGNGLREDTAHQHAAPSLRSPCALGFRVAIAVVGCARVWKVSIRSANETANPHHHTDAALNVRAPLAHPLCRTHRREQRRYASSSRSTAERSNSDSGVTSGAKRSTTSPLRFTRNFSKFQRMSWGAPLSMP